MRSSQSLGRELGQPRGERAAHFDAGKRTVDSVLTAPLHRSQKGPDGIFIAHALFRLREGSFVIAGVALHPPPIFQCKDTSTASPWDYKAQPLATFSFSQGRRCQHDPPRQARCERATPSVANGTFPKTSRTSASVTLVSGDRPEKRHPGGHGRCHRKRRGGHGAALTKRQPGTAVSVKLIHSGPASVW